MNENAKSKLTISEKNTDYANMLLRAVQKFSWVLLLVMLLFGWTSPVLMLVASICMIGPIVFSFSYGRAWCGNFCPRGSLSGSILSIISPNKPIPKILKSALFRTFMFLFLMALFAYNLYHAHGTLFGFGLAFIRMIVITTIMQIFFAIFIHPYAWCVFCPMGSFAALIARIRKKSIGHIQISSGCVSCGNCTKNCPMQLDIPNWYATGEVADKDCIKCRKCVDNCPQKNLMYN